MLLHFYLRIDRGTKEAQAGNSGAVKVGGERLAGEVGGRDDN